VCASGTAAAPVGDASAEVVVDTSPVEGVGGGPDAASDARFGGSFEGGEVREASVGACFEAGVAREASDGPCVEGGDVVVTVGMGAAATTGS
jgi:hypothetical protein